jgi:hypothetical protein
LCSNADGQPRLVRVPLAPVNSMFVVQSMFGAIQEYAGFDRPAWLD